MTGEQRWNWNLRCSSALHGWNGAGPSLGTIQRNYPELWDVLTSFRCEGYDAFQVGELIRSEFDKQAS